MEMNQFYAHSCVCVCVRLVVCYSEGRKRCTNLCGQMHKMNIKLKLKLKLPLRQRNSLEKAERQHPVPQACPFPPLPFIPADSFRFFGKKLRKLSASNLSSPTPEWSDPHGQVQIYEGCSAELSPLCTRLTAQLRAQLQSDLAGLNLLKLNKSYQ